MDAESKGLIPGGEGGRPMATGSRPRLLQLGRGFGVMLGGPVVLVAGAAACIVATARALFGRRRPGWPSLAGSAAVVAYVLAVRPALSSWGARPEELAKALPGDDLVPDPGTGTTRAVTIDAPVEAVWPWLAQLGQDRGGFYSYEWLENLAGCRMRNADSIHSEWQRREVGETVPLHPAGGLKLARFQTDRAYAFEGGWYFVLEPEDGERTRLIARGRSPRGVTSVAYALLLELPHFIMERKMLLGIKARAERARRLPPARGS